MNNKKEIIKKTAIITTVSAALIGAITYEVHSIIKKEYERQSEILGTIHTDINLNLDMIKIAIQTSDPDAYSEKLSNLYNDSASAKSLFLVKDEQNDYLTSLDEYINSLEEHKNLISEITILKQDVSDIEKVFKDNYSDKGSISRDKLTGVNAEIIKHKLSNEKYSEEKIVTIVNSINTTIDNIASKAQALTDCIDSCYASRIGEITDELAEQIKSFSDQTTKLNQDLEDQFDFDSMDQLKS